MSENGLTFEYEELESVGQTCKVYFKDCEPPATLGAPGDMYLGTIQKKMKLYGRVADGWKVWAGPAKKEDTFLVHHPSAPNHILWGTIYKYGWFLLDALKGSSGQSSHDILQAAQKRRVSTAKKREKEDPSNPPSKRQKMTLAAPEPSPSASLCAPPPSPSTSTLIPTLSPLPSTSLPPLSTPSTPLPPPYSPPTSSGRPPSPSSATGPRLDLYDLHKTRKLSSKRRKSGIIPKLPQYAFSNAGAPVGTRPSKPKPRASALPEILLTPSRPAIIVSTPTQSRANEKGKGKAVQSATPLKLEPAEPSMSTSSAGATANNVIDLTGLDDDDDDEIAHIPVPANTSVVPPQAKYDNPLWQLDYPPSPTPTQDPDHPSTPEAVVVSVEGPLTSEAPDYSKSPSPVYPTAPPIEGLTESQRDAFMSIYERVNHEKHEHTYMCKICIILHGQENGELAIDTNDTFIRDNQVVDVHKQLLLHLLDHWDFRVHYETFTVQDLNYKLSCHIANFSPS
ncbi:hypothetical protein BDZ89DRAFT_1058146 [Hymenopellis radicata]|nr:hypothetical protein BDZ89DRAFT_1058146 [Hymenopellis radicata]